MVVVTDCKYFLENKLLKKLDIMIKRIDMNNPKKDAVIIMEGAEGEGKTNSAVAISYYVKSKTNRDIHLFFRLEPMIEFAKNNEKKIIIWDEPSLDALSTDHYKKINKDLLRLLMTVRKKQHFFIFNFTKFYKFSEYIVVDRAIALIHMYSRKEVIAGRFNYIRKNRLEALYNSYRSSKKRLYAKLANFRGSFPEVMEKHLHKMNIYVEGIPNATLEIYEQQKDLAIKSIGEADKMSNKESKANDERDRLLYYIKKKLDCSLLELEKDFETYNIPMKKSKISYILQKFSINPPENEVISTSRNPFNINNGVNGQEIVSVLSNNKKTILPQDEP